MDKCHQEKCCLDKCLQQLAYVTDGPRSLPLLPLKFGQNRPVTAEIFMIWTNVVRTNIARTNVAWTNVIMTELAQEEPTTYL